MAHERDVFANLEKFHGGYPFGGTAWCQAVLPMEIRSSLRRLPYRRFTMARDTITELNIEVRIPRHNTTAKPRTGPEPNRNNARPAIRLVTLESRIVPNARS